MAGVRTEGDRLSGVADGDAPRRGTSRSWTAGAVIAAVFVVAWIVFQVGLPLIQVIRSGEEQFGWEMFSRQAERPTYSVQLKSGTTKDIDWSDYVSRNRGDFYLDEALPPHICTQIPEAVVIFLHYKGVEQPVAYRCKR